MSQTRFKIFTWLFLGFLVLGVNACTSQARDEHNGSADGSVDEVPPADDGSGDDGTGDGTGDENGGDTGGGDEGGSGSQDTDGDGVTDDVDEFPTDPAETNDTDGDGVGDNSDNCVSDLNADQTDTDADGLGDTCDNCADLGNEAQTDTDSDGAGDVCDAFPDDATETTDTDGDGVGDNTDAFPDDATETTDTDGDGIGDNSDAFPEDPDETVDTDGDGVGDNSDAFPTDPDESADSDGDGLGDNEDTDDDDDGFDAVADGGSDCDDTNAAVNPDAAEIFDLADNDCDGVADLGMDLGDSTSVGTGKNMYDSLGFKVAFIGDVNGDGYADMAASAPYNDDRGTSAGAVYIYFGSSSPSATLTADRDDSNGPNVELAGAGSYSSGSVYGQAGTTIAGAGDVNGDGKDDILVGAPGYDDGSNTDAGRVYLVYGSSLTAEASSGDGLLVLSSASATFTGENKSDYLGEEDSIAGAGDVNADGCDDFVIASYGYDNGSDSSAGKAYLFLGKGSACNGDASMSGSVSLSSADATMVGADQQDYLGKSVAGVGDVDADGYDDFLVGAPGNDTTASNAGRVYLIYGSSSLSGSLTLSTRPYFVGQSASDSAGLRVAAAGDVNGDGMADMLIGAPSNDNGGSNAGAIYLIEGASYSGLMSATTTFVGESADDNAGYGISSAGDLDGDGLDDLIFGSYLNDDNAIEAGKIYIFLGSSISGSSINLSDANATMVGELERDYAGKSVSGGQDMNGDGLDDVVVSAKGYSRTNPNIDKGRVYINFGAEL
ncbi:MAG: hypothetical protein A3G32_01840 [Deltaproteobacteria bacterium RIFCSPLOWO2_12_FULL_40_28]|nr:MAG: hypothetical protein A3C45_06585 [Deltaproteobacteria bacterium RIFCSPHIGHO2_02_FULL_40_28]OGQ18872.1 MAG: hypothetical protein A3E27_09220 [Deltaproteobacteria bacterium RIFCSPHIGHO2_12_FULL_40_32]OGQ40117.1 MAG: hypothetical protein A3I69_01750 [Deltaproteobacteria bacterium RIFCSPLOWO2_02_FULL_40_36]OGQ53300.1 MAG: hypothetical protein A3G32_01840 [Deltaproteobacteria bacterium RIFCSPLOWO2_12_FULL_40_28]